MVEQQIQTEKTEYIVGWLDFQAICFRIHNYTGIFFSTNSVNSIEFVEEKFLVEFGFPRVDEYALNIKSP